MMVSENEKLKKIVRKLKKDNMGFKTELAAIKEEQKISTLLKQFVTTREIYVQTDPPKCVFPARTSSHQVTTVPSNKPEKSQDSEKLNRMMVLHTNMVRRYERELKVNMEHLDTITGLNLKVNELMLKIAQLEKELDGTNMRKSGRKAGSPGQDDKDVRDELKAVKKERDKLSKENRKLREELKGLDLGFFDEIEDIKFALQQSAKLNKEYEKCLRKVCLQFGVPYPNPERHVEGFQPQRQTAR